MEDELSVLNRLDNLSVGVSLLDVGACTRYLGQYGKRVRAFCLIAEEVTNFAFQSQAVEVAGLVGIRYGYMVLFVFQGDFPYSARLGFISSEPQYGNAHSIGR